MYSQSLEEQYILDYFGDYIGTFLDLGCNDCLTFSNTRALALKGWKGVFVDPSPKAMVRCKILYNEHKGHYFYPIAISSHNGKAILQESGHLCNLSDVALVSTFHQNEMARFKRTVTYEPIEVKTFKWKTFYNRLRVKKFDFINIDVEGDELNILPDMDLTDTKVLVIEHNGKQELKKAYLECTTKYGLDKIIYESGENLIIVR